MPVKLQTLRTVASLRRQVGEWRAQGLVSALVPTMGALHEGHLELVRQALRRADRVVVSIFVNPRQFGPGEDFERYPRDRRGDTAKLRAVGAHVIYWPDGLEMYPDGFATEINVAGPARAGLEDAHRTHFFTGVATVVAKLFIQAGCDYAMFGEKDYQQLKVVTRLVRDLNLPITVIGVETVREADGLAMSSRNVYLGEQARALAPQFHETLAAAAAAIRSGCSPERASRQARDRLERAGFRVDYVEARDSETLEPVVAGQTHHIRLLAAVWLDDTRLIDNLQV